MQRQNQVELIIMGTQGASGLKKTIIGSITSRIIEKSDIPVLVVPEKYELKDPREIVFATNYHCNDRPALSFTLSIAKVFNASVTVLHINTDDNIEKNNDSVFFQLCFFSAKNF